MAVARLSCGNTRHLFFGGYEGAQRTILIFLPDYMKPEITQDSICPLAFIRVEYLADNKISHRDFLGSLMGTGIKRETIGDILVGEESCDIVVLKEVLSYLMANFESVGRLKVKTSVITAELVKVPEEKYLIMKDTVASMRLDNVVSSGFLISREKASEYVKAGRVFLNFLECSKVDKIVSEGDAISLQGMDKIKLHQIGNQTKKGRIKNEILI
ncbi:MAG: YlmH/Sll1252 family protein [Desulfitobacteriaceae bacterium]|nr:YlmH/Sll1252 family protein [Desulfitobacteriaceae bacterium]